MRILVVGAGAIGGYFGGRLLEAGCDVTFLVRPRRAALLAEKGLRIASPAGDFHAAAPRTVTADAIAAPFDAIILSCKAYDLDSAVADIAPAVGPRTAIVPLLNGMKHLDVLDAHFGQERVLGGQCAIASTLLPDGTVRHMSPMHSLSFGERAGGMSPRVEALAAQMQSAKFDGRVSADVMLDMWEKWSFLSAIAAITSLMRAPIGDIVAGGGKDLILQLIDETFGIAARSAHPPRAEARARAQAMLTQEGSLFSASMMRDIEAGNPVEADHVIGDLIARAVPGSAPVLTTAYIHLKAYEARRAREAAA